jgi:hypothetical protein
MTMHICSSLPCDVCDSNSTVVALRKRVQDLEETNHRLMESCDKLRAQLFRGTDVNAEGQHRTPAALVCDGGRDPRE